MSRIFVGRLVCFCLRCFSLPGFAESIEKLRGNQGLKISPVQLNINKKGLKDVVGQGSYMVNAVSGCADCHGCPRFTSGHNPCNGEPEQVNSANYLAGGRLLSPILSTNLTPDSRGLPGGLTLAAFKSIMKTGKGSNGQILQWHPIPI